MFPPAPQDGQYRTPPRVLVIEHDDATRDTLTRLLAAAGYPTAVGVDGETGLAAALEHQPDLVVFDPRLPDLSPEMLLSRLRDTVPNAGTVVVSCTAEEPDLVALLDAGADECSVPPDSEDMFLARVRAVLRRAREQGAPRSMLRVGGLSIDLAGRSAALDGEPLRLSPREFDLLAYLAQRVGQVVGKRELMTEVWQLPYSVADKTIDVHVSWLRRKLNECAQRPRYLHTVRGSGLRLDGPPDGTQAAR